MSDTATAEVATATPTKKAPAKAKAKTNGKPKTKAKASKPSTTAEFGAERSHDLPWSEKKVKVFKLLRHSKLTNGEGTAQQIADLSSGTLTARDVRHYCYHAHAAGLVSVKKYDEGNNYHFSLTAKGKAIDPDAELKKRKEGTKAKAKKAPAKK